jgi:predicted RNA-binding Zn ribbon-like protein
VNLTSYAELAVRLVNSAVQADGETDPLSSPVACAASLGDCLAGVPTRRDVGVLEYVRDEFASIFRAAAAGHDKEAVERLNALLIQFPVQPELVSHDDQRWHVHLAGQGAVSDRFAAGAVIGVSLMVSMHGVSRLGVCAIASCPRVFFDASPGKSRRYCAEHSVVRANVSTLRREGPPLTGHAPAAAS